MWTICQPASLTSFTCLARSAAGAKVPSRQLHRHRHPGDVKQEESGPTPSRRDEVGASAITLRFSHRGSHRDKLGCFDSQDDIPGSQAGWLPSNKRGLRENPPRDILDVADIINVDFKSSRITYATLLSFRF